MKKIVIFFLFIAPLFSHAQFKTLMLSPGQQYKNETTDTLAITTIDKLRAAVVKSKELTIALQEIDKSNELIQNLEAQTKAWEEKSNAQKEMIESYKRQVEGSETNTANLKAEAKRQKRQKLMVMGGSAVLVVLSIFLF